MEVEGQLCHPKFSILDDFFKNIHLFGCCQALVVACRLSCPVACGILVPGPEIKLCPLHCKADSYTLDHQESLMDDFFLTHIWEGGAGCAEF